MAGEYSLRAYPELPHCIIRVSCLYETHIRNDFVSKVLTVLENGGEFEATTRLSGNPTYVPHLATAISKLLYKESLPNIIHLGGKESLTRYEFALMIANAFGYDPERIIPSKKKFWVGERPVRGGFKVDLAEKLGLPIHPVINGLLDYKQNYLGLSQHRQRAARRGAAAADHHDRTSLNSHRTDSPDANYFSSC